MDAKSRSTIQLLWQCITNAVSGTESGSVGDARTSSVRILATWPCSKAVAQAVHVQMWTCISGIVSAILQKDLNPFISCSGQYEAQDPDILEAAKEPLQTHTFVCDLGFLVLLCQLCSNITRHCGLSALSVTCGNAIAYLFWVHFDIPC